MSFTIPTATAITAATAPMEFVVADTTTTGAHKGGKALLWGDVTGYATYLADSASTAAEVTALQTYTDGYVAGFQYTMDIDMTNLTGAASVDTSSSATQSQTYGVCFTGSETAADGTVTAGTSCAGAVFTYTLPDAAATVDVDMTWTYLYAPDQTTTVDTAATWSAVTLNATNAGLSKSWACTSSGNTFPTGTGVETAAPEIITCARFLPLEANMTAADIRFEPTVANGFSGSISTMASGAHAVSTAITLTASATTALTGAFQAATVAGAVALAALTF